MPIKGPAILKTHVIAAVLAMATTPTLAGAPYEVVRIGDRAMSCEAMADEINSLTAMVADQQKRADRKAAGGGRAGGAAAKGLASGLIYGATSMAYGVSAHDALISGAAQGASDGVAAMGSDTARPSRPASAPPVNSPERQRLDHLNGIYRDKAC